MAKDTVRVCTHCNGQCYVWNPKTKKNDIPCPACGGKGYVIVRNI